jgi:uncharacterized membrane protein
VLRPLKAIARFFSQRSVQNGIALGAAAAIESYQPSLMPRPKADQALVVAGSAATGYLVGSTMQRTTDRFARITSVPTPVVEGAVIIGGVGAAALLARRNREALSRAAVRTTAEVKTVSSITGLAVGLLRFGTQRLARRGGWGKAAAVALAVGAPTADAAIFLRDRIGTYQRDGRIPPDAGDIGYTITVGSGIVTAAGALGLLERAAAGGIATGMAALIAGPRGAWIPFGHLVAGGSAAGATYVGGRNVIRKIEASNDRTEPGYRDAPTSEPVSGSSASAVRYEDLGVQGRRFVNSASSAELIAEVMGENATQDAVRVYIGFDCAGTVVERVDLAIEELRRTGGFDRSLLMVGSPAGTGYFNYIPVEAAEYMTRGDMASVAVQYGKRPSMLSYDRVPAARRHYRTLLEAIRTELEGRAPGARPRVVLYGESLGAHTGQDAFLHTGTNGPIELGVDRALWVGTPYFSKWKKEIFDDGREDVDPAVFGQFARIEELEEISEEARAALRFFFLNHYEDPVARFGFDIAIQQPDWLGRPETRPPNISRVQRWTPGVTFWQTAIDTKNAARVIPGEFKALGHDYRADLAEFVRAAYDLGEVTTEQMASIEARLRRSEIERAARIDQE